MAKEDKTGTPHTVQRDGWRNTGYVEECVIEAGQ